MSLPLLILGAGGHAKVLINTLQIQSKTIIGITDPDNSRHGLTILNIPVIGNDDMALQYAPETVKVVNGLGSVKPPIRRKQLFNKFKNKHYHFTSVIHPSTIIAAGVKISEGSQVMAGTIIQPGCFIGQNTIINTGALIDHDCRIGDHCHISPGATLSGNVSIGDGTHVGTGATVIQNITIGPNCLVAAGSVIVKNIGNGKKVKGVPATEY